MAIQNGNAHVPSDLGFRALALFLRLHGVNTEPDQLRDRCGDDGIGIRGMLRCAREFGVKVRASTMDWPRLAGIQLPGIASLRDGGFLLLGKIEDQVALVLHPTSSHPRRMTRAEFEAIWDGGLISPGSQSLAHRARHAIADIRARAVGLGAGLIRHAGGLLMRIRDGLAKARDTLLTKASGTRARFAASGDVANEAADTGSPAASMDSEDVDESGLIALAILLRCHGIAADPAQIHHRVGAARLGVTEILRCAKEFGLQLSLTHLTLPTRCRV